MPSGVLAELAAVIAITSSIIFHRSWRLGKAPDARKRMPHSAKPKKTDLGNPSVVSLSSVPEKLMEQIFDSYFQVHKQQDGS